MRRVKLPGSDIFIILFIFIILVVSAQTGTSQELPEVRLEYPSPAYDTNYLVSQFRVAEKIKSEHPDSAWAIYRMLINESRRIGFYRGEIYSLYNTVDYFNNRSLYDSSLLYCLQGLALHEKVPDDHGIYIRLLNAAIIPYFYTGKYDTAIAYSYMALEELNNNEYSGPVQAMVLNSVGSLWLRMGDPNQALYYLKQGELLAIQHGDIDGLSHLRSNIGGAYISLKKYDTAKMYLEHVTFMEQRMRQPPIAHLNLAAIYLEENMPEKAIPYFNEALKYARERNNYFVIFTAHMGLGSAYLQMKDYARAEQMLLTALDMLEAGTIQDTKESLYQKLAALYEALGKYEVAFRYQKMSTEAFGELFGKEKLRIASQLEAKYKSREKDRQLVEHRLLIAEQENRLKDRNLWIGGAIGCSLLLGTLLISLYRSNIHKQKIQAEKIRNLNQEKEIERLRALMEGEERERRRIAHELHDGIGSQHSAMMLYLHTIQQKYGEPGNTPELQQVIKLLKETADELRTTAHNLMPELLEQQGLEIAARTYCERISRTKSLRLDFFSYGALDRLDQSFALVIYRAIQELVHNAVKHAAPKRLTVMMTLINDSFSLTIEDDGLGIQAKESDGMGLLSMKSRIQQLGGEMLIETGLNSGTSISISFSQVNLNGN